MHFSARRLLAPLAAGLLTAGLLGGVPATSYAATNPVTPGTFTGLGFDQCEAPSGSAMRTWMDRSPFRAAGIYISGASRACQRQTNLTASWVSDQLADGWHLMPITLGPQASCSSRYPRYGRTIDPTIDATTTNGYAAARAQGSAEARSAVARATALGIVKGSTIFYDLEAFDTSRSQACTSSALWFLDAWTDELHRLRYASGFYSSAASGIKLIDDQRVKTGNPISMPDQIWIADWDGKATTSSTYVRSDGWQSGGRAKQFQGGHDETWGGVRINIDRNYLSLRTPVLPAVAAPAPTPAPAPAPTPAPTPAPATGNPAYTGSNLSDARCSPSTINQKTYRRTGSIRTAGLVPLQCLLKQQRLYPYAVTGSWNPATEKALAAFQKRAGHPVRTYATRNDWISLVVTGNGRTTLKAGTSGSDVTRVQRALNAATDAQLSVTGRWNSATADAVGDYQRGVSLEATEVVGRLTWGALEKGRF